MEFGEWCLFAALPILVTPLGPTAVASLVVLINIEQVSEIATFGFQDSIQTFVGNALGAGSPHLGKKVALEIGLLCISINVLLVVAFSLFGESIISGFTSNEQVIDIACDCLPIFTAELFFNQLQLSTGSVLHGLNRMEAALISRSVCYYLLFIPALLLAQHYQCAIWVVVLEIEVVSMLIVGVDALIIRKCDWEEISKEAIKDASEESLTERILIEEEDSDYF